MKTRKTFKAIPVISVAICIVLLIFVAGCASTKSDQPFYQLGQLEQQQDSTEKGEPVILAEHFTIYSDELDFLTEEFSLTHPENAADIAAQTLIEKYTLFYQAQKAGLVVSDADVEAVIRKQIEIFAETPSEEYDEFLAGLGMTNEEYWNSRKDELIITESIAAWKEQQFDEYARSYEENADSQDWENYYDKLKNSLIEKEHIQYQNQ